VSGQKREEQKEEEEEEAATLHTRKTIREKRFSFSDDHRNIHTLSVYVWGRKTVSRVSPVTSPKLERIAYMPMNKGDLEREDESVLLLHDSTKPCLSASGD
jgi:hypothetical protein